MVRPYSPGKAKNLTIAVLPKLLYFEPMTLSELQKQYHEKLSAIYSEREARSITQLVFEKLLQVNKLQMAFERFRLLTGEQQTQLELVLQRLAEHEPAQYILGEADFCGLKFKVDRNVLIPRPETEELVHWISEEQKASPQFRLLDLGTGSGCIPIALSKQFPKATIEACDISEAALNIAQQNNVLNQTNAKFYPLDILTGLLAENTYDIIVSNPPYITQGEKEMLAANVIKHEPHLALFAPGGDDLIFYRVIAQKATIALTKKGKLFFEINQYKGEEIKALLKGLGYTEVTLKKDIHGANRMVKAQL